MDFVVGTESGLFRVGDDGSRQLLLVGAIKHVVASDEGCVALRTDNTLWNVDEDGAQEFDEFGTLVPTCVLLNDDDVWLGTEGAHLIVLRGGEAVRVKSFDDVPGRETWHTPMGLPPSVRSLDVDDAGTLYVNVHVGGILRSLDNGETWEPTIGIGADVHQVSSVPEYPETAVAACAQGLAITIDSGATWEIDNEGLHATYCRAVAVSGDYVIISASDGPSGSRTGLYYRALDGTVFGRCRTGLPNEWFEQNIDTHCIAAWDEVAVAGLPGGNVYMSTDSGESWRHIVATLPEITSVAIL